MIFSREGFKALRFIYGVTIAGFAVAAFLTTGSYWYWQAEKKIDLQSGRSLRDLQGRVNSLRIEREELRNSDATYLMLVSRGTFAAERRLDLVETFNVLRTRHKLAGLEYEVSPQRVVRAAVGQSFPTIDVLGSRIRLKIRTYHDGDLLAFLDEFPRMQRGFFPIDRCAIRRSAESMRLTAAAPSKALADSNNAIAGPVATQAKDAPPSIEAECIADWVTFVDKAKPHQTTTGLSFLGRT